MKLSTKLILSFSLFLILLISIGTASYYFNNRIKSRVIDKSKEAVLELEHTTEMGLTLYQSLVYVRYYIEKQNRQESAMNLKEPELSIENARQHIRFSLNNFRRHFDEVFEFISSHEVMQQVETDAHQRTEEALHNLDEKFNIYEALVEQLFVLSGESYNDANELFTVTIEPYFRSNLMPAVDNFRERTKSNLNREISQLNYRLNTARTMLTVAVSGSILITLMLVYYLYQSITLPLKKLTLAAQNIGEGNLEERITVNSKDEVGELASEFNRMAENLNQTTFSKDYVDNIIESMADALIVTDEEDEIVKVNSATLKMLGYQKMELYGQSIESIFVNGNAPKLSNKGEKAIHENVELNYLTKTGESIPVNLSHSVLYNDEGKPKGMVYVASDISQHKAAQEQIRKSLKEKEILLAEIHHRVKNNLAVISGLLQMQIWDTKSKSAETALRDSQLRVQSIALVHEKLYQSDNLSEIEFDKYIRDLVQAIMGTYTDSFKTVNVETELDSVELSINQAIPCALLINELIVNSHKHAFDERKEGKIKITLAKENSHICLTIRDDGNGLPEGLDLETEESLGMSLINTFVKQLDGKIRNYNDNGAVFDLKFKPEKVE